MNLNCENCWKIENKKKTQISKMLHLITPQQHVSPTLPTSISLNQTKTPLILGRSMSNITTTLLPPLACFPMTQDLRHRFVLSRRHAVIRSTPSQSSKSSCSHVYHMECLGRVWINGTEQDRPSNILLQHAMVVSIGAPAFHVMYKVDLQSTPTSSTTSTSLTSKTSSSSSSSSSSSLQLGTNS